MDVLRNKIDSFLRTRTFKRVIQRESIPVNFTLNGARVCKRVLTYIVNSDITRQERESWINGTYEGIAEHLAYILNLNINDLSVYKRMTDLIYYYNIYTYESNPHYTNKIIMLSDSFSTPLEFYTVFDELYNPDNGDVIKKLSAPNLIYNDKTGKYIEVEEYLQSLTR